MEKVELPIHKHPLLPFTRFSLDKCEGCKSEGYIYGGYRCNEVGCEENVYHKECAESLPEINHSSHPDHPLKLVLNDFPSSICSWCRIRFVNGYICSICDFKLDLLCAKGQAPLFILEKSNLHEHPLQLFHGMNPDGSYGALRNCVTCNHLIFGNKLSYLCYQCGLAFQVECAKFFPEATHNSHPEHPFKLLTHKAAPEYVEKECLLCGTEFYLTLHHCDVCNFNICTRCMSSPPPLVVVSPTTHEHQLHVVPRPINFTCNACGTQGDRSPYFCLQCNFMIHWECIDLPRVININRHDHRVSYTRRLGRGNWKCGVCRNKVDGFYGAYSCSKCSNYVVHARCATRKDVWDMIELEGTQEEPEEPPFVVIDDSRIKHFSHDHNLRINEDWMILHENTLCQACVLQICSEPFYSCEQCEFVLHEKCAKLPRKKRHVCHNKQLTLDVDSKYRAGVCYQCDQQFTGFRFKSLTDSFTVDVRCGSISEPFEHESHPHPLYYLRSTKPCTACGKDNWGCLSCDEGDFSLCFKCALLPHKVMRHRYDDHPLFLSYGESSNVDGEYWCEACETKVDPKKWFYTCKDCGVILHISCLVGDSSYIMPGLGIRLIIKQLNYEEKEEVVPNTSICRPLCYKCNTRCRLPSVFKTFLAGRVQYFCSYNCGPES